MPRRYGFSLTELVIATAIMFILAALAISKFASQSERSALQSTQSTFHSIERALHLYYARNGSWPADVTTATMPPGLAPYLAGNPFDGPSPLGGSWEWNGQGSSHAAHGINLSIKGLDTSKQRLFDRTFDDSSLTTGDYRLDGAYYVRPIAPP